MNTPDNIDLITVGQLVEELAEFEEEYSDWDVVCWTPDGEPCYPTSMELDEDGDLCIALKQDDGENYNVGMLLEELDEYDDDTLVYVKARGLYLNIEVNDEGTVFGEDCDEESDIDVIACHGSVFGEYEDDWEEEDSFLNVSFLLSELAWYKENDSCLKIVCWDNDHESQPYYFDTIVRDEDGNLCIGTTYEETESLDVAAVCEILEHCDGDTMVCVYSPDGDLVDIDTTDVSLFCEDYDDFDNGLIACYRIVKEKE